MNPDNGPARVLNRDPEGVMTIRCEWSGNIQKIKPISSVFTRYRLFDGVPVGIVSKSESSDSPTDHLVGKVLERVTATKPNGLWSYRVALPDREEVFNETELVPLASSQSDPISLLEAFAWKGQKKFFERWAIHRAIAQWHEDSGGIPTFLGARIRPLGHQLYAARRVLWDRVPRFVLADEVGLGKTIEVGLIIHSLRAENPSLRVLIIAPGAMSRQWQCELYLRFGAQAYRHVDASGFRKIPSGAVEDDNRLIVSTTALERHPDLRRALANKKWDMVVVDEAHQFTPDTNLYSFFQQLARQSYGFLALSATSSKRELESLTGLLSLIAPEAYAPDDRVTLKTKIARLRVVWDRLNTTAKYISAATREKGGLDKEDREYLISEWEGVIENDPVVTSLLQNLKAGVNEAADELVSYVQEFHRIDHRIIRTRRSTVYAQDLQPNVRTLETLQYPPSISELQLSNHLRDLSVYFQTTVRKKVFAAAKRAGIAHMLRGEPTKILRHSYRSWLGTTNAPVAVIKGLMRHADIRTTLNEYGNGLPAPMREANSKVVRMVLR